LAKIKKLIIFATKKYIIMEKFKYIIIDDEPPAHITARHHINANPNYSLIASFYNPQSALDFLQENEVDLIFLDIKMQEMNGFQFLDALTKKIFVVFLTAFPEKFSFDAHRYIDRDLVFFTNKAQFSYYLPKILARFEKMHDERAKLNRLHQLSVNEILTFPKKVNKKYISLQEILFFMIIGHNVVIRMKNGKEEICRMSFKELKSFLPSNDFVQVNRSVIVNTMYLTAFSEVTVCILEQHFRISKRRRNLCVPIFRALKNELFKTIE
jgi:DNA-binding LytR/AlgR family response regulator